MKGCPFIKGSCKYYDDEEGCLFYDQGSGNMIDMPCYRYRKIEDEETTNKGWIRTDEKMPEKGETVLACDIDDNIYMGWMRDRTHLATVDDYYKNIIAWMPLPEPYKGGEE